VQLFKCLIINKLKRPNSGEKTYLFYSPTSVYFDAVLYTKMLNMSKILRSLALLFCAGLFSFSTIAQTVIKGNVKNASNNEGVGAVSVEVKGTSLGTFTDPQGNFSLTVPKLPVTLVFTSVGFEAKEVTVSTNEMLQVDFKPLAALGQEVVVSASRVQQRILESPVTIERVNAAAIRNAPAASFYDVVANLKGVDVMASSLTFKTPTTRGFNGSGNTRFTQIVDGMDNQAPGLNFSVGSVIGLSELDVDNMELLPGASSALYGPGGMNGTLIINSKNPFKYQGLSFQIKQGVMHTDGAQRNVSPYYNWNVRWAKKIGEKFAFKITSELIQAKDWLGTDFRNYERQGTNGKLIPGNRQTDPNYDGVNVYGDETTADIRAVFAAIGQQAPFLQPYINSISGSPINVSRSGYNESEIVDPNTINYKVGGSLNYKVTDKIEAVLAGFWGTGNTVYTGSERYSLKNLKMAQYKFELNHKNWFFRAFTTQENAGESFNMTVTTRLANEAWRPSSSATNPTSGWYFIYGSTFLSQKLNGLSDQAAHDAARATADAGRPAANSPQFRQLFNQVASRPISKGGGLFLDKTDLYGVEGQYNLSELTKGFADVLVGANFRRYVLNSEGTLFADSAGVIPINEFGAYIQASKGFADDRIKLTVSGRYDKNQNFEGRFTPRATAVIKINNDNNVRLSFQTAYRFPSTQQQWISLDVGSNVRLLGGVKDLQDFYRFSTNPIYTLASVQAGAPVRTSFDAFKPESVTSYEVGYKGLLMDKKLLIDAYGYYGQYQNFIVRTLVAQSRTGNVADLANPALRQIFSVPDNTPNKVTTYGFGLSLDYRLPRGFVVSGNASSDVLSEIAPGFIANFNSPRYRTNLSIGNNAFAYKKRMGFNIIYRWQDSYFYESDFATGQLPAVQTVDAQISYRLPAAKSVFKIGANNLLNQYYRNGFGNPMMGGLYYVSYGYNIF
jgi:outer membrane receptor protein involved in Fe transport